MTTDRPELEMVRSTVRRITKKFDRRYWQERVDAHQPMTELWEEIANAGFLGVMVPEEYGGGDMGIMGFAALLEEFANQGINPPMVITCGMAGITIARHGTKEQKDRYLPPLAAGKESFCFSITEPNAGTNTFNIETLATRDGDEYVINGRKIFTTAIDTADHVLLVARTKPAKTVADKREGLSLFLLSSRESGIQFNKIVSRIPSPDNTFEVTYDDVRVPAGALIGEEGRGLDSMFDTLNPERVATALQAVGLGRYALARAVEYANVRKVFGDTPIGAYQGLAHPMARAKIHLEIAALTAWHAAELFEAGADRRTVGMYANMGKYAAGEAATDAADIAIQVHGGMGFTADRDMVSIWTMVRSWQVAPVTRELILNHVGEHILGLPRSY
jgi:acyl-CoA dehydrogenase